MTIEDYKRKLKEQYYKRIVTETGYLVGYIVLFSILLTYLYYIS